MPTNKNSIKVVIETPKGSTAKYDYDPVSGRYELNKIMPAGMVFPFDFGFIPGTIGGDGDPLDILVLSEVPVFTGCAIDCRIIGCITARQKEKDGETVRNDRFIGIPEVSKMYGSVQSIPDLPEQIVSEVEKFFIQYNELAGKVFTPLQHLDPAKALKLIADAQKESIPPAQLVQIFLPLNDQEGKPFPQTYFSTVKAELTETFGGVTLYSRSPASGLWEDEHKKIVSDTMLVCEVMTTEFDIAFWQRYKKSLLKKFGQKEMVVRKFEISTLPL